jgi:5-methylcytosine-specific restriction endonuclease McrA
MPIRAESMALYPGGSIHSPEWQAIRAFIRARAGDCCEECGVRNYALGGRLSDGTFLRAKPLGEKLLRLEWPAPGEWAWCGDINSGVMLRIIRIVCTVAHLDGKLTDHSERNLKFLCQRCHNRHDHKSRMENAAITRHEKAGQLDLIGRN